MSLSIIRGGADAQTSASFAVITDTAGTYTLTLDTGASISVEVADASDYQGFAWGEFTGLELGRTYAITASGPGGSASSEFSTIPESGVHKTLVGNCYDVYLWPETAGAAMERENADQCVRMGDAPYVDALRQTTLATGGNPGRVTVMRKQLQSFLTHKSRNRVFARAACFASPSDHDYIPGNDAPGRDDTGAFPGEDAANWWFYNGGYAKMITATGAAGQAEWEELLSLGAAAFAQTNRLPTNPEIGQTFGGGVVPADAPYTRWTVGRVEYFLLDQLRYAGYITQQVGVTDRPMMGATQTAWLLARIAASTATFKVILSAQHIIRNVAVGVTGRNDYRRACYSDEGSQLLAGFSDFTGWTVPGGLVVMTGDVHSPSVYRYLVGEGFTQVCGSPTGAGGVPQLAESSDPDVVLSHKRYYSGGDVGVYYSVIEDSGDGPLRIYIKDHAGSNWWSGQLNAGSNAVSYPQQRFG